jgi:DNA-binding HxlR family transcriptional regulator
VSTRSYGDACGIAQGVDVIGERWATLVVRELLLGPMRFGDLQLALPGAAPNVLTQRLRELEAAGVLRRRRLDPPSGARVYELTDSGAELEPILVAIGDWAVRSGCLDSSGTLSAVSAMLTLKTYFAPTRPWRADYDLRLGNQPFAARVTGRAVLIRQGSSEQPVATIDTAPKTLLAVMVGDRELRDAPITITGDRPSVERLLAGVRVPQR